MYTKQMSGNMYTNRKDPIEFSIEDNRSKQERKLNERFIYKKQICRQHVLWFLRHNRKIFKYYQLKF